MNPTQIRYTYFPLTEPPAFFAEQIVNVFKKHEPTISTVTQNAHDSNEVLAVVADDLSGIGFDVEGEKGKIKRPVFYGKTVYLLKHIISMHFIVSGSALWKSKWHAPLAGMLYIGI